MVSPARVIWLSAWIALACSSDPAGPDDPIPACTGPVTIEVSGGTSPTFDWTPRCRLFFVLVESGAADQWIVLSEGTNAISPPVRYGEIPAGAIEEEPALPLESGQTYDVTVARWTGPGGDDGVAIGNQEFVP